MIGLSESPDSVYCKRVLTYLLRRTVTAVLVALGVVTVVFLFLHLIPGDPVDLMLGESARATDRLELRRKLGLDRPLTEQYVHYLVGVMRGDLGESYYFREPVLRTLATRYPATLELTLAAMAVGWLIALPTGLLAAAHQGRLADRLLMRTALVVAAMPSFWLGPLLLSIFAVEWDLFPVSGREGWESLVLPAFTLGTGLAALMSRMTRAAVVETLHEDYIRTALAKGLGRGSVLVRHALPNALLPLVTVAGLQFGALLSGAVVTETIFSWPGIGRLLLIAIQTRDYPLVQGGVLLIAVTYVAINLLSDLLYAVLDPRIRLANV